MTVAATNGSASTSDPLALARQAAVPNRLKECVTSGRLAHSFSIKLVKTVEIVHYAAAAGYDAILIDLEHSSFGLETTNQLSCAALQVGYVRDLSSTSLRCIPGCIFGWCW
jgi:hypothetical protein